MFLEMEGLADNSDVYCETILFVSIWAGQNHLLHIGIICVLSGTLILSHFSVMWSGDH